jgi:hypothetical protein
MNIKKTRTYITIHFFIFVAFLITSDLIKITLSATNLFVISAIITLSIFNLLSSLNNQSQEINETFILQTILGYVVNIVFFGDCWELFIFIYLMETEIGNSIFEILVYYANYEKIIYITALIILCFAAIGLEYYTYTITKSVEPIFVQTILSVVPYITFSIRSSIEQCNINELTVYLIAILFTNILIKNINLLTSPILAINILYISLIISTFSFFVYALYKPIKESFIYNLNDTKPLKVIANNILALIIDRKTLNQELQKNIDEHNSLGNLIFFSPNKETIEMALFVAIRDNNLPLWNMMAHHNITKETYKAVLNKVLEHDLDSLFIVISCLKSIKTLGELLEIAINKKDTNCINRIVSALYHMHPLNEEEKSLRMEIHDKALIKCAELGLLNKTIIMYEMNQRTSAEARIKSCSILIKNYDKFDDTTSFLTFSYRDNYSWIEAIKNSYHYEGFEKALNNVNIKGIILKVVKELPDLFICILNRINDKHLLVHETLQDYRINEEVKKHLCMSYIEILEKNVNYEPYYKKIKRQGQNDKIITYCLQISAIEIGRKSPDIFQKILEKLTNNIVTNIMNDAIDNNIFNLAYIAAKKIDKYKSTNTEQKYVHDKVVSSYSNNLKNSNIIFSKASLLSMIRHKSRENQNQYDKNYGMIVLNSG